QQPRKVADESDGAAKSYDHTHEREHEPKRLEVDPHRSFHTRSLGIGAPTGKPSVICLSPAMTCASPSKTSSSRPVRASLNDPSNVSRRSRSQTMLSAADRSRVLRSVL